jgi:AraC family transcriptional regulator
VQKTMSAGEFHGARRDTVSLEGLTLAETEYAPGHRLAAHAHARPFFSFLIRGSFREELEHASRECVPTSLVFYPEHEPHQEAFGERGGRCFHVELGADWLDRMKADGMVYEPGSSETLAGRRNVLMTRLYTWFRGREHEIAAEEIVLELLAEVTPTEGLGREPTPPAWLDRLREMLHERRFENIRVTDLADEAKVHPVHAARVFRRHHGCTIGEYQRALRIERARVALADERQPLSSIALATGFADQAHFTRRFKEAVGLPPGEYRKLVLS